MPRTAPTRGLPRTRLFQTGLFQTGLLALPLATGLLLAGCPRPGLAPADETTTTTTTTTTAGECASGAKEACYSGPPETARVGACTDGKRTCDASGAWGACEGEVLPTPESCVPQGVEPADLDCDGALPSICVDPVVFVKISNPGVDAGSSVMVTAEQRVLWAGIQSPTAGDLDGFVQLLEPDGAEVWTHADKKGPGVQQVFQAVADATKVYVAGTGVLAGGADQDGFTSRLTKSGIIEEDAVVSSPGTDMMTAIAIAGSPEGGVFAAGTLGGTSLVPEGGGSSFGGPDDLFVMQIRQDGFVPWNMVCAGSAPASSPRALVRDAVTSKLYLGLIVRGILQVPEGGGVDLPPLGADPSDGVVYVIDPTLDATKPVTRHRVFHSTGADTIEAITTDDEGHVYVAGTYAGDELFLDGTSIIAGNPDGQAEAFVAHFDQAGTLLWARRFGGPGNQRIQALAFGGGALYLAGTLDADGNLFDMPVTHGAGVDLLVAKILPATAELAGLRVSDGTGDEWPAALAVDDKGRVWVTGDFSGDLSFAGEQATANGAFDAFLFRLPP